MIPLLRMLAEDPKIQALFALIVLDFVLGVAAAVKRGEFRLSYIGATFKDDIAGRLIPYAVLVAALRVGSDLVLPGLDLGIIEGGAFTVFALALSGSLMASLKDLGIAPRLPDALAGPEQEEVTLIEKGGK
jgi:hypothetical protein